MWPTVTNIYPFALARPVAIGPALGAGLICILNAFRISEILELTIADVMHGNTVFVKAKKGGVPRFFHLPQIITLKGLPVNFTSQSRLFPVSYKAVKRAFEQNNLVQLFDGYMNKRITHLGRHKLATSACEHGHGASVGELLGHKSKGASDWYKKEVDLERDRNRKRLERSKK